MWHYLANILRKTRKDRPVKCYQDGLYYGAVRKRMLGNEKKKRHAEIADSRNAVPEFCKGVYETGQD
jgi:hypothetical protein